MRCDAWRRPWPRRRRRRLKPAATTSAPPVALTSWPGRRQNGGGVRLPRGAATAPRPPGDAAGDARGAATAAARLHHCGLARDGARLRPAGWARRRGMVGGGGGARGGWVGGRGMGLPGEFNIMGPWAPCRVRSGVPHGPHAGSHVGPTWGGVIKPKEIREGPAGGPRRSRGGLGGRFGFSSGHLSSF